MKNWFNQNKVFLMGLLSAIAIILQPFLMETEINWASVGLAAGLTVLSYLAKEWRGQGLSITGIIGIAADTVYQLQTTGTFTWERAILGIIVAILAAAAPDPKSRGYEHTPTIVQAKKQGEAIVPAKLTEK